MKPGPTVQNLTLTSVVFNNFLQDARKSQCGEMKTERNHPVLRSRRNEQFPAKQITPSKVKKLVSVAGVFKRQPQKVQDDTIHVQPASKTFSKIVPRHVPDEKAQSLKARSSSRSPRKPAARVIERKSDQHPWAIAFKGMCTVSTSITSRLIHHRHQRHLPPSPLHHRLPKDQHHTRHPPP
jgi:hypothetical protein